LSVKSPILPVKSSILPAKAPILPVKSQILPVKSPILLVKSPILPVKPPCLLPHVASLAFRIWCHQCSWSPAAPEYLPGMVMGQCQRSDSND